MTIENDGWRLVRTRGNHRQYRHPNQPGTVTIAGHPSQDVPPGTLNSILKQAGLEMNYLVVYERSSNGWGAYVPDLPGLGVVASSLDEVQALIREGIEFHLEGMKLQGEPIPEPSAQP